MSEGVQITIPGKLNIIVYSQANSSLDFDDDEYNSSTIPFGRSGGHGFGFGGGGSNAGFAGPDSPTVLTPVAEHGQQSFFTSHTRGDSVTSVDSTNSAGTRHPNRSNTSFAQSSQTSVSTPSSAGFSKKPSFASIRNAFKGKNIDMPPVPQLDYQMKSPFNRSTSSLNNVSNMSFRAGPMSPSNISVTVPFGRPPTPGADRRTKSKGHKSYHSQTGSIGSDNHAHPLSSSPPPVPRVPNGFGDIHRSETPDFEDDKVVMDPKTPSDFALHAIFIRFASLAEGKIDAFLRHVLVS